MRTKHIFLFLLSAGFLMRAYPQEKSFMSDIYRFLENPEIFELNQTEGHSLVIPYASVSDALKAGREKSTGYMSLNGAWKFFYSDVPENLPARFFEEKFNDSGWNNISVPSNWEMQGFGDPLFRNVTTPFHPRPPFVPREYNPTGIYRKSFSIPASWKEKEIFLRMEKTASASFVWINGKEVGYNEGAQEPAEYNVTKYIRPGKNTICVIVFKYSDGYYLEDQDYWRLAGIFYDIMLVASPKVHMFDWHAVTDLDESYTDAILAIDAEIHNYSSDVAKGITVRAILYNSKLEVIKRMISEKTDLTPGGNVKIYFSENIKSPELWSAENPYLYHLSFELLDAKGNIIETSAGRIGFKETEIKNQVFYLNGVPVKLNGINSHMQHPETGHTMDEATIRKDFNILKQFNINCVRTSHYPPVNKYLELADEYGVYIIDETGDEAHATEYLSGRKEWEGMYRERARKMVLRDRNHPSVLFWSAGNESGEGDNICAVIEEGKKYDTTRYWMYGGNAFAHKCEEIIGPRYPQISTLLTRVYNIPSEQDPRPSFLDEYLAVTGNGGGGLDEYWELFRKFPRSMGGAIWDFVSTGITQKIRTLKDGSGKNVQANIMGRAKLVPGFRGKGLDLNGHDQWVEIYRDDALEINGQALTITLRLLPRKLNSSSGALITKGNWQFGINQVRNDSLRFYLTTRRKYSVNIPLPSEWEDNWHHIAAVYDGKSMFLVVDGKESEKIPVSGNIQNTPFPVNIGRNAEIHGQETSDYLCDAVIDQAGIFREVIPVSELRNPDENVIKKAVLWLDFEEEIEEGEFFSYGIGARTYGSIWPNRIPQPEMWQIKKSGQPVSVRLVSAEKGEVEIINRYLFTELDKLNTVWCITADGEILEKGELRLNVPPNDTAIVTIPYHKPEIIPGTEYHLMVSFQQKTKTLWAEPGFEIAWEQFEMPWYESKPALKTEAAAGKITTSEKDGRLIISGDEFIYEFDRRNGQIVSMKINGKELIKAGPEPNFWRAPLANETDEWGFWRANRKHNIEWFGRMPATEWYSTTLDEINSNLVDFSAKNESQGVCINTLIVQTFNKNQASFINRITYFIDSAGEININHSIIPDGDMSSWLPRAGVKMILDKSLGNVEWYGRGPQENYPDRKSGYKVGKYRSTVTEMYEPYLIPQDYGLRTDNRRVRITDNSGTGFEFRGNKLFNFNYYPFSTDNLTKAVYTYQLHPYGWNTLNIDYSTSGTGCTALSVFPQYQVMPQRFDFELTIKPVKGNKQ